MKKYISIDIGGTFIKYGLINENGEILEKHELVTEANKGGEQILEKTLKIVGDYKNNHQVEGVAISTAGMVDTKNGSIRYASELIPGYTGINFKDPIKEKFDLPCYVENDVNCAGLAEYKSGAGKDSEVALIFTIGTGIGGCAIINGEVYHGVSGSAMEIGYMNMQNSTFETLASAKTLVEKVADLKDENVEDWDGKKVFDLAKNGDEICIKAIDEMCEVLAIGISNMVYVLNPDTVILGGGIMAQGEYLYEKIDKNLEKYLEKPLYDAVSLKFASQQNAAGMLGAFYNFKNKTARD
ncbi:ROK family protein [uncultured Anaerococcus sp.]|uniref:ROK family protein n=1 Tax=uncultured Anaerococcus sp. TaxID=293428 RepID=UPI0025F5C68D|nr:ROK family protein [uncultured Anaerococcus sp.]